MNLIQSNAFFCSRIQTFKEIKLDILISERNLFHMDCKDTLKCFYGNSPDSAHASYLARKLATLCITINEYPSLRYQASSNFARDIALILNDMLSEFKSSNPAFVCNGDDRDSTRDRGQLLICDRTFDTLSPLMHEYTYQAIANDLLNIVEGCVTYNVTEGKGSVEKKALLNENDEFWMDLKYQHIAQVINSIKDRMQDIIQNNASAGMAKKTSGGTDVSIAAMSAAVKELPEYRQTMAKLGQHVSLAQQCMNSFGKNNLMAISQLEQTMSTGLDEDGKEFKGPKLVQLLGETLEDPQMSKIDKIRLLAIFIMTQKGVSASDRQSLIQAAKLNGGEQQVLMNFEKIGQLMATAKGPGIGGVFGGLFGGGKGAPAKPTAPDDGGNIDTRHTCELKNILEAFISGNLPSDKWYSAGPAPPVSGESKVSSVRTRKFGNTNTNHAQFNGGRIMAFVAGGICYSEIRSANEIETKMKREIILGGSCIMSPKAFMKSVAGIDSTSERLDIFNDDSLTVADGSHRL